MTQDIVTFISPRKRRLNVQPLMRAALMATIVALLLVIVVNGITTALEANARQAYEDAAHEVLQRHAAEYCDTRTADPKVGNFGSCGLIVRVEYSKRKDRPATSTLYLVRHIQHWESFAYVRENRVIVPTDIPRGCWKPKPGDGYYCTFIGPKAKDFNWPALYHQFDHH